MAAERGLILVDTKYEFGKDADDKIIIVDEIHTPDSSRYWIADTYEEVTQKVFFCYLYMLSQKYYSPLHQSWIRSVHHDLSNFAA